MKEAGTQSGYQGLANPAWQNNGFAQKHGLEKHRH
jgi:hypothetical protein